MTSDKKTILVFSDWYLPGYKAGGPIRSVSAAVHYLRNDFNILIVTRDTDFGDARPYSTVRSNVWTEAEAGVSIFYASEQYLNKTSIFTMLGKLSYDIIYLNSFFSAKFSLLPLFGKLLGKTRAPVVIAPRGMLGGGALGLKFYKKKLFLVISRLIRLYEGVHWHATSTQEALEIRAQFGGKASISIIPNFRSPERESSVKKDKNPEMLRLIFLSRISEKKNILFALQTLEALHHQKVNVRIHMDIYGPVEDLGYWNRCLPVLEKLEGTVSAKYCGEVDPQDVTERMKQYDFLFLPTLNENFGHVIAESLSAGTPVIVSDQTPWRDLESKFAGWSIPLSETKKFQQVILLAAALDKDKYAQMSENAKTLAADYIDPTQAVNAMKIMFKSLM
jgi:glycosyltransferase involved in cell wall biosynthesis